MSRWMNGWKFHQLMDEWMNWWVEKTAFRSWEDLAFNLILLCKSLQITLPWQISSSKWGVIIPVFQNIWEETWGNAYSTHT